METFVCPWWLAYAFDHRLRRLFQRREKMFGPYLSPGMAAADIGCGLGFSALGLAELVGPEGKVLAVDVQEKMLKGLMRRAAGLGLEDRIRPHLARPHRLDLPLKLDFAVAFWMIHEVADKPRLLAELEAALKPGGRLMIVEPRLHVSKKAFEATVRAAEATGLALQERPWVFFSQAVVLKKAET